MQQGVALMREIQTYISPHAWFQDQLKECITRATEITTDQGEHKVDQGKVKTMEDIDATAMDQFKKDFLSWKDFQALILLFQMNLTIWSEK